MCVIYMMSEETKAIKDHGRLILYRRDEKVASQPIRHISGVVVTKQAHITMPLVYALLEEGIPISYMDFRGRVLGVLGGERISLEHLFRQKEVMERPKEQIRLVREIVCRKIGSQPGCSRSTAIVSGNCRRWRRSAASQLMRIRRSI